MIWRAGVAIVQGGEGGDAGGAGGEGGEGGKHDSPAGVGQRLREARFSRYVSGHCGLQAQILQNFRAFGYTYCVTHTTRVCASERKR
jgi:hypothetical protein